MFLAGTNRTFHVTAALLIGLFVCFPAPAQADDNAGANRRLVEAVGYLQQADTLWASEPSTEGVTLKEFLGLATFVPGSYQRFIASRPTSQIAAMTLAFERVAALLRKALDTLKSIPATYPSSNLAVTLITGQAVGDISIPDLEEKLATLHYLISAASPAPPQSPSETGTPSTAMSSLPDPQTVQSCVDDPDFTKPDCLATFAYDARKRIIDDAEIAMALAHIAAAYRAAGQEQAFTDTFNSARDILERELADTQHSDDRIQNIYVLAIKAALHGFTGHGPQAYAAATAQLAQDVRTLPPGSDRDTAAQNIISQFALLGLLPEDVLNLDDVIEDPARRLVSLNTVTFTHAVNGNLRAALHAAQTALTHAEDNPETVEPVAFDIAAAVAYALTEGFTPETEHLIATIPSLASEGVADDVLVATYVGAGDIDAARVSLARIPKELHRLARIPFIAKAQARNGEYAAARSTAKAIPDLYDKIHTLSYVALHQAGDPPDLPSAARLSRKNRRMLRDRALGHIVRAHLAARNHETAQQAAKLMSDGSTRNELLSQTANLQEQTDATATAQEHLASGDFGAALAAAEILIEPSLRDAVLQQIARGQLQAGNPSDAHTTATRISDETIRDALAPDIARAFADNGDFDQALKSLSRLATPLPETASMSTSLSHNSAANNTMPRLPPRN